jgi:cryptochrome
MYLKNLIDADWSICSGNWMWVSSSAFEKSLNSSFCLDPAVYGWRLDPHGTFAKKYLPELAEMPVEYIYQPWKAPIEVSATSDIAVVALFDI